MPFVRIDLGSDLHQDRVKNVSDAVHNSLTATFNVPQDDRFQVIHRHAAPEIVFPASYLGIQHKAGLIYIQMTCNESRTVEMKKALFRAMAASVSKAAEIPTSDVIVNLVEVKKENWSFGDGVAQYAAAN